MQLAGPDCMERHLMSGSSVQVVEQRNGSRLRELTDTGFAPVSRIVGSLRQDRAVDTLEGCKAWKR